MFISWGKEGLNHSVFLLSISLNWIILIQNLFECRVNPLNAQHGGRKWSKHTHTRFLKVVEAWVGTAGCSELAGECGPLAQAWTSPHKDHAVTSRRRMDGNLPRTSTGGGRTGESAGYTIDTKRNIIPSNWYSSSSRTSLSCAQQSMAAPRFYHSRQPLVQPTPPRPHSHTHWCSSLLLSTETLPARNHQPGNTARFFRRGMKTIFPKKPI